MQERVVARHRKTRETDIDLSLNLDGNRTILLEINLPFFPHLLNNLAFYAGWNLTIRAIGDLDIDLHHTVEDIGIVLGMAFREALEGSPPIQRFAASWIPMDEALAQAVVDVGGRPYLVHDIPPVLEQVGQFDTELVVEFLRAFATNARITLHTKVWWGNNTHHIFEAQFKSIGRTLGDATRTVGDQVISTKGVID